MDMNQFLPAIFLAALAYGQTPVTTYQVQPGNGGPTNSANMARALAQSLHIYIPPGTYNFSSAIHIIRPGQTISCANQESTTLQFTGATDGIIISDAAGPTYGTTIENCGI